MAKIPESIALSLDFEGELTAPRSKSGGSRVGMRIKVDLTASCRLRHRHIAWATTAIATAAAFLIQLLHQSH
jgi:hypothetical protein